MMMMMMVVVRWCLLIWDGERGHGGESTSIAMRMMRIMMVVVDAVVVDDDDEDVVVVDVVVVVSQLVYYYCDCRYLLAYCCCYLCDHGWQDVVLAAAIDRDVVVHDCCRYRHVLHSWMSCCIGPCMMGHYCGCCWRCCCYPRWLLLLLLLLTMMMMMETVVLHVLVHGGERRWQPPQHTNDDIEPSPPLEFAKMRKRMLMPVVAGHGHCNRADYPNFRPIQRLRLLPQHHQLPRRISRHHFRLIRGSSPTFGSGNYLVMSLDVEFVGSNMRSECLESHHSSVYGSSIDDCLPSNHDHHPLRLHLHLHVHYCKMIETCYFGYPTASIHLQE